MCNEGEEESESIRENGRELDRNKSSHRSKSTESITDRKIFRKLGVESEFEFEVSITTHLFLAAN